MFTLVYASAFLPFSSRLSLSISIISIQWKIINNQSIIPRSFQITGNHFYVTYLFYSTSNDFKRNFLLSILKSLFSLAVSLSSFYNFTLKNGKNAPIKSLALCFLKLSSSLCCLRSLLCLYVWCDIFLYEFYCPLTTLSLLSGFDRPWPGAVFLAATVLEISLRGNDRNS